ncbi:Nucleoside-diphosphate-sugar epimerase [Spironucleus salmonicida]|uniref:Nucleoside-diphosphate-sugar epimerase n=1 Tax=Spironucleus salmonicida TaxID=348837 RepID=V6LMZ6_9EUKA|nr:Nucleoside-diphosphate-sugar epimerase [Spironucleus salmonicida]|eukprot:EST46000.1 Nucleoside-diphosphate-sugar epimerase [Spironucleus salmonicida]
MKIIITGFNGFIGKHLMSILNDQNDIFILLCRQSTKILTNFQSNMEIYRVNSFEEPINLSCDILVHLAGSSKWGTLENSNSFNSSICIMKNLMDTIKFTRFVYISSGAADLYEKSQPKQLYYYALSKYLNELQVKQLQNYIILRPGEVYGKDDKLITAQNILNFQSKICFTTNSIISVTDANSVAFGIKQAIYSSKTGIYNLGGENISIDRLARIVQQQSAIYSTNIIFSSILARYFAKFGKFFGIDDESIKYGTLDWYQDSSKSIEELQYKYNTVPYIVKNVVEWLKLRS